MARGPISVIGFKEILKALVDIVSGSKVSIEFLFMRLIHIMRLANLFLIVKPIFRSAYSLMSVISLWKNGIGSINKIFASIGLIAFRGPTYESNFHNPGRNCSRNNPLRSLIWDDKSNPRRISWKSWRRNYR